MNDEPIHDSFFPEPDPFCKALPTQLRAWDSTSLRCYLTCPRKYQLEIVQGWRKPPGPHVEWGRFYHAAVEYYDTQRCLGMDKEQALDAAVQYALNLTWDGEAGGPWETGDAKKNRYTLLRALVWYVDEQRETDGVQPYCFPDGRPGVEISFQLPLPLTNPDGEPYLLCGHIDSVAYDGEDIFPRERKTTQHTLGSYYFDQYEPDIQIDTYDMAFSILFPDLKASGIMVEATQTAVGFARFHRHFIHKTEGQREEHVETILDTICRAEKDARDNYYPMNKAACFAKGGCQFREICNKDPSVRERFLEANYIQQRWNPLIER